MTAYFTSDWHLGHQFVANLRGYADVNEHDAAIAVGLHELLGPRDQLWVLGDVTGGASSALARVADLVLSLPCPVHLISGNHDGCHPMHRDAHKVQHRYLEIFHSVQPFARIRVMRQEVLLSHFPYTTDRDTDKESRYTQYRLPDHDRWLLHGHLHTDVRHHGRREIHIGLDAWNMRPVSLHAIEEIMKQVGDA